MKNNFQKLTALLAATAMLASLMTGCADTSVNNNAESSETNVSEVSTEATETTVEVPEFSYPMDGVTVSYALNMPGAAKANFENMGDTEYAKTMEAATGIHVDWVQATGNAAEWFNLMLADAEYADIIEWNWARSYAGGLSGAYNDGIAIELNDVIDQYMPNFKAWLEANPDVDKLIKTDDGKYYGIPAVTSDSRMGNVLGYYVRQDWMDELKIETPDTIEGWHDALVKIKETKGITPLTGVGGYILKGGSFINAYAPSMMSNRYSLDAETGKVVFTAATEGYKEFLTTMAQWYSEGLIDKDFATIDTAGVKAKLLNEEAAMGWGYAGGGLQGTTLEGRATNPDFTLAAVATCAKEEGAEMLYCTADPRVVGNYAVITTQCENVETAARYLDFLFSEEGILISNFGIEGVTYTAENGVPTYTDEILKNPDGLNVSAAMGKYIRAYSAFPGVQDYNYLIGYYELDVTKAAPATWGSNGTTEYELPALSYTEDETSELSTIQTELNTYADEMAVKFVLGTEDIETKWDEYLEALSQFGMDKTVEINQTAYERFLAR